MLTDLAHETQQVANSIEKCQFGIQPSQASCSELATGVSSISTHLLGCNYENYSRPSCLLSLVTGLTKHVALWLGRNMQPLEE